MTGIYGHVLVQVRKQPENLRWLVTSAQNVELVAVPWRLMFDQSEIVTWQEARYERDRYDPDRLAALEICMYMVPLDEQDIAELERKHPGLTRKAPWYLNRRLMDWIPEEVAPRRRPRPVESRPVEPPPPQPNPAVTEPAKPDMPLTREDAERKLLF